MTTITNEGSFVVNLKPNQYNVLPPSDANRKRREPARAATLLSVGDHVVPYVDLHVRGTGSPEWSADDVTAVVDRYLKAAELGSSAADHQPSRICPCCRDRNEENIKQRAQYHLAEHPGTRPLSSERAYETVPTPEVGIYRSESPDLTMPGSGPSRSSIDHQSPVAERDPEPTIHVVNPEIYKKYPYPDHRDKPAVSMESIDAIVDATSKFNRAMKRLNNTIDHLS